MLDEYKSLRRDVLLIPDVSTRWCSHKRDSVDVIVPFCRVVFQWMPTSNFTYPLESMEV